MRTRAATGTSGIVAHRLTWRERLQICRCVGGTPLACGCLLGHYETYAGRTLTVVDHRCARCGHAGHEVDAVLATPDWRELAASRAG